MNLINAYTYENYFAFDDKIITIPRKVFNNTIIYQKEAFIKIFQKEYNKKLLWLKPLRLIVDDTLSINDINALKSIIEEIFKNVTIIKDSKLLKISKNNSYLIKGNKLKLYYTDYHNIKHTLVLDESLTKEEIDKIIEKRCTKDLMIINYDYTNYNINYYFDDFLNIFKN